ncbi:MAG: class I SAM-dependent methyltransferase [Burkholderiaceae bacterium]
MSTLIPIPETAPSSSFVPASLADSVFTRLGWQEKLSQRLASLPLPLALRLPGGQVLGRCDAPVQLHIANWGCAKALVLGDIGGLADHFVMGTFVLERGSMREFMDVVAALLHKDPVQHQISPWGRWFQTIRSKLRHSLARDAGQIGFHYDVSDDYYALWLDARRVYSCAYFRQAEMSLAEAQEAKLDHICRKLLLQPGQRFLDIGAGWGGLLLWAAEHYGVDATGITLSKNQYEHVNRLIAQKGLSGRVRMQLLDYRQLDETTGFDRIASVGMFEHVGRAQMTSYFAKVSRLLKPGGLLLNHSITSAGLDNAELGAGMGDFIEKYIFPGGELTHISHALNHLAQAGLEMVDTENLRPHYGRTLWAWSDGLEQQLDAAVSVLTEKSGHQRAQETVNAYRIYLGGCAMAFDHGWLSLHQVLAMRPHNDLTQGALRGSMGDYPFNRSYIYSPN